MSKKRRFLVHWLGLMALLILLMPSFVWAAGENTYGSVHVVIENTTYPKSAGAPWEGVLVDTQVELQDRSTMMTCIRTALGNIPQTGADGEYISRINGLGEFDGGAESGWMGTLNDWFVNESFSEFTRRAGELRDGDEIRVMYTRSYGNDLGSSFESTDKRLKTLSFSAGKLTPSFRSDTHEYQLTLPEGVTEVAMYAQAMNKNFQRRFYLRETEYRQGENIQVEEGTVLTVKVGDPSWPSMSNEEGEDVIPTPAQEYTISVSYIPVPLADPEEISVRDTLNGVMVCWTGVEDADHYTVCRKVNGGWKPVAVSDMPLWVDHSIRTGTTAVYGVVTGDWDGQTPSCEAEITVLEQPKLTATKLGRRVLLTWRNVPGADSYTVYVMREGSGWTRLATAVKSPVIDCVPESVEICGYKICAHSGNVSGRSGRSVICRFQQRR